MSIEIEMDPAIAESMEILLSQAVRQHPLLYNNQNKYYSIAQNADRHQAAWIEISEEVNLEVESCKTLWACIKQKYTKYRKRLEIDQPVIKEWPVYTMLNEWLDNHIKRRRTRNDIIRQIKPLPKILNSQVKDRNSPNKDVQTLTSLADKNVNNISTTISVKSYQNVSNKRSNKRLIDNSNSEITIIPTKRSLKLESYHYSDSSNDVTLYSDHDIFTEIEEPTVEKRNNSMQPDKIKITKSSNDDSKKSLTPRESSPSPILTTKSNSSYLQEHCEIKSYASIDTQTKTTDYNYLGSSSTVTLSNCSMDKFENILNMCVKMTDKCLSENQSSTELFGKYLASLIREVPEDKRLKTQMKIISFAMDVISKDINIHNVTITTEEKWLYKPIDYDKLDTALKQGKINQISERATK